MFRGPFVVNDPRYAPFGLAWLRGVTPERFAVVLAVSLIISSRPIWMAIFQGDLLRAAWLQLDRTARTLLCALPMLLMVLRVESLTARSNPRKRVVALALAVLAGAASYSAMRSGLRIGMGTVAAGEQLWQASVTYFAQSLVIGGTLTAILFYAASEAYAVQRLHETRLQRVEIERHLAEAKLQLLRAQIEPHFLFNSLASVKRLYEGDPGSGRALLADLADYLRAAAASAQCREVRLGDEVALARSFLRICQLRMGRRLNVRIDIAPDHESALVPPMAIGTLVENAIKHGLGPRGTGGTLTLTACREGEALVVGVGDDGVGFRARFGPGVGLSNTRSRLATLFGRSASLDLAANPGGGVTATLRVPYRMNA